MHIRPRSPYEGLTSPRRQPPTRSANRNACFPWGKSLAFRDFSSLRTHFQALRIITSRYCVVKVLSLPYLAPGGDPLHRGNVISVDPSCVAIHAGHFLPIDERWRTIITHAALVHEDAIPLA